MFLYKHSDDPVKDLFQKLPEKIMLFFKENISRAVIPQFIASLMSPTRMPSE